MSVLAIDTHNRLVRFDVAKPKCLEHAKEILGLLVPGEQVLGIDQRPATGELYVLGSSSRIYTLDADTGSVTPVGAGMPFTTLLQGTQFGFNFNPVVDRIRIVSNTGQNLRVDPNTGLVASVDGTLEYNVGDVNFGAVPRVSAASYTNSVSPAPLTTVLYDIDPVNNVLATQLPPNSGTLNTVGTLVRRHADQVNPLLVGFDIQSGTNDAYLSLVVKGKSRLYRVNLETGAATFLSEIGCKGKTKLRALTVTPRKLE